MIQVLFKGLEPSEMAKEAVIERLDVIVEKFPDLQSSRIRVTLEMENSPHKPGPDQFTVKLHVFQGRYRGITVSKSESNLYVALADVVEHMLEKLNRFGDRNRVKKRTQERRWIDERSGEAATDGAETDRKLA